MYGFDWWWDIGWNPFGGCNYVSVGCRNCFVPNWLKSHTHSKDVHHGVTDRVNGRWVFNGKLTTLPATHERWDWPLLWAGAEHPKLGTGKPSLIWIGDMSDPFHVERPKEIISRALGTVVISCHIGLVLTKRTGRMAEYFTALSPHTKRLWQPKLLVGFSAENQETFDRRWVDTRRLAETGWFVFVSIAPMLGPVTLPPDFLALGKRTWVIVSGEQRIPRTRCRDMDPNSARAVRDQCRKAGIPFFMKQMANGAYIPPDLQIRQFPSFSKPSSRALLGAHAKREARRAGRRT
jgi:protein gp37